MSDKQDVMLAMARARKAIAEARTNDAVEKLADVLDGILSALNAEPALRIDYTKVAAPTLLNSAPRPPREL